MKRAIFLIVAMLPAALVHATPFQLTFTNATAPITFSGAVPSGFDVNNITVGISFDNGGTSGINQSMNFADITEAFIQSGSYSTTWTPSTPGWSNATFVAFNTDASGFLSTPGTKIIGVRVNPGQDGQSGSNQPILTIAGPDRVANPSIFKITFSNGTFASPQISHNGGTAAVPVPEPSSLSLLVILGVASLGYGYRERCRRLA